MTVNIACSERELNTQQYWIKSYGQNMAFKPLMTVLLIVLSLFPRLPPLVEKVHQLVWQAQHLGILGFILLTFFTQRVSTSSAY